MVSKIGGIIAGVATAAGIAGGIVLNEASRNAAFSYGYLCRNVTTTACSDYLNNVVTGYALGCLFLPLVFPLAAMHLGIYLADKVIRPKQDELSEEHTPLLRRKFRDDLIQNNNNR